MESKKAQEFSVATVMVIILGVLVLVFLIYGFSVGWKNIAGKLNVFGGDTNIDQVRSNCKLACQPNAINAYCVDKQDVTLAKGAMGSGKFTCEQLEGVVYISKNIVKVAAVAANPAASPPIVAVPAVDDASITPASFAAWQAAWKNAQKPAATADPVKDTDYKEYAAIITTACGICS